MTAAIDLIEDAIVGEFTGRLSRPEAVAAIRAVLHLTEAGAVDLLDHPVAPRARYGSDGGAR